MRRLFGCPDIISLTEKFLMARKFFWIFTENNPVMGDSKTFCIPEAKGLNAIYRYLDNLKRFSISNRIKKGIAILDIIVLSAKPICNYM